MLLTPTRPTSKSERRQALETPHQREHEASVERAMSKGIQPKGLDALVAWFRECIHNEAPTTIHKNELWRDWGHDGDGGSKLGTLAWSEPFRRFIEGVDRPSAFDDDGRYRLPLRAAIARWARRPDRCVSAQYLYQMALLDGDWRRLADRLSYPHEFMELYMKSCLHEFWREYSDVRMRT